MGCALGQRLALFTLPCGKLTATVGADSMYREPARLAWLRGAMILISVSARAARSVGARAGKSVLRG